jgi:RNA polymerase sigma-70 factor (ECF subfamily)
MEDASDSAGLVRRIGTRAADAGAAEAELCRRFAPRARLYGLRHLRDEERARDLAQAVMLAVIEAVRAGRVEEPEHIDRFVLGTCRNVALRMRDIDARARPTDVATIDAMFAAPEVEPLDVGALHHCLGGLDERGRTVVLLSFTQGRSAEQISAALETTVGNVRVLRHRALAQLRQCMDSHEEAAR